MPPTHLYYSDVSKNKYHIKILSYPNKNIQRLNVMVTASSKPIKQVVLTNVACLNDSAALS